MKSAIVSRVLQSLALTVWGVVLVYFYVSDRIANYLAPDFRVFAFVGGIGLVVMGLFTLLTAREHADCGHDHGPEDQHDHESLDIHPAGAFLIMAAPLLLASFATQDRFSMSALTRKGLNDTAADAGSLFLSSALPPLTREIIEQQHPPDENGYRPFPLMELFFTSADPEMRDLVDGMPVVTEGRLVPDTEGPENRRRLYRLFITCCAADSRPIPIVVEFEDAEVPQVEDNTWMTLSGTISFPDEGKGHISLLKVDSAKPTEPPFEESFMRGF